MSMPSPPAILPMSFQGSWATVSQRATIKDKFDFDCTAMPTSNDGKSCINAAGGAWGIAKNTKDVDAAWKWIKFLTSTESTNVLISDPLRSIPGRKSSAKRWDEVASRGRPASQERHRLLEADGNCQCRCVSVLLAVLMARPGRT